MRSITIGQRALSSIQLLGLGLAIAALYALATGGGTARFWHSLMTGAPVGLEAVLSEEELATSSRLDEALTRVGYRLDGVAQGRAVPALFVPRVPADLGELAAIDARKRVFLRVMLPLVLAANEEIAADRVRLSRILGLRAAKGWADPDDEAYVAELAQRYGGDPAKPRELLARIDVVPPSLALAQAIEESGWGTSRFVREGNNLFGQVTSADAGLVPEGTFDGRRLARFDTLFEAVRAYVRNLNTHRAYQTFRKARQAARDRGIAPDGHALAGALVSYSERGPAYVDTIRAIIRKNNLGRYDRARLRRSLDGQWVSAKS